MNAVNVLRLFLSRPEVDPCKAEQEAIDRLARLAEAAKYWRDCHAMDGRYSLEDALSDGEHTPAFADATAVACAFAGRDDAGGVEAESGLEGTGPGAVPAAAEVELVGITEANDIDATILGGVEEGGDGEAVEDRGLGAGDGGGGEETEGGGEIRGAGGKDHDPRMYTTGRGRPPVIGRNRVWGRNLWTLTSDIRNLYF